MNLIQYMHIKQQKELEKYPDDKEYQLIGLIHDLGKVLFTFGEPDYAVVGDTYVVGCKLPKTMVYYNETVGKILIEKIQY